MQKENADKEKEKEKQERIEASLREREREVRASQAELAKAREKEKEQHLRDKAEQHFNALLADMVRVYCSVLGPVQTSCFCSAKLNSKIKHGRSTASESKF